MRGTIYGPLRPDYVILTSGGKNARRAGYADRQNADGTFMLHGEGQKGDQDPSGFVNRLILEGDRLVLLFTTHSVAVNGKATALQRYMGEFRLGSWNYESPTEGLRKGDRLLQLTLHPVTTAHGVDLDGAESDDEAGNAKVADDLQELRKRAARLGAKPVQGTLSAAEYKQGSLLIRKYAALRADGACEYRGCPAPFVTAAGQPFLEVHHIRRLADDGPDSPANVAALCPNCHREAHLGPSPNSVRDILIAIVAAKEAAAHSA